MNLLQLFLKVFGFRSINKGMIRIFLSYCARCGELVDAHYCTPNADGALSTPAKATDLHYCEDCCDREDQAR